MHVRLQCCCQGAGIWRKEVNSVTQSRREFTKPEYLPFESASFPGYRSLEKQSSIFLCTLSSVLLTSIFSETYHVYSQLISLTFQYLSLSALIHERLDSPVLFHLPWAGVQAAKITANFFCSLLFSCLVFIFHRKTTWKETKIFAQSLDSSSVLFKMHSFNQLEGEQALVSFMSPEYIATGKAAQASLSEGAFQLSQKCFRAHIKTGGWHANTKMTYLASSGSAVTKGQKSRVQKAEQC